MAAAGPAPLARRPLVAVALLLAAYAVLSLLNDPRGQLGSDSGGKVATLKVMEERDRLRPDLGYWAERFDPAGQVHPLVLTQRVDDRWVNVTTLPMLYAAFPLYRLGGYRLALLVPMLGGVAAALAARALARRLADGDGWSAFWLIGLASPVLVYALDFWEHTVGLAAMAWGVVALWDLLEGERGPWAALTAGGLFGVAATMRTEALAYGAVAVATAAVFMVARRRRLGPALITGSLAAAGLAVPLLANLALEVAVLGKTFRSGRAAGTAADAGAEAGLRLREALAGAVGLFDKTAALPLVLGLALVTLMAVAVWLAGRPAGNRRVVALTLAGAAVLYGTRVALGPAVLPGLAVAAPLAVVGGVLGWRIPRARYLLVVALAALPLVWATQYPGAALNHVGARYVLLSGLLLATLGVVALGGLPPWARRAFPALAVAVTAYAFSFMVVRTNSFARAGAELADRPEPVLVSRFSHLHRDGGAFYGEHLWLSAASAAEQRLAVGVVERAGFDRFGLVLPPGAAPGEIAGWRRGGTDRVHLISDLDVTVTTYERG